MDQCADVAAHAFRAEGHEQVIYLHMVGGPSQMDLFDYKPVMRDWYDNDLPESVRNGQRLTTMTSGQARFPIAPSMYRFERCGQSGMWISELLPNLKKSVDDLVFIRSMHTEAINHEPAITLMQSGNQITGRPCLGAWASYGLGSLNDNLPTFVVMVAKSTNVEQVQAISARLWSSGFLPGTHAGVSLRTAGDPILYINDPPGVSRDVRRASLDGVNAAPTSSTTNSSAIRKPKREFNSTNSPIACSRASRNSHRHRQRTRVDLLETPRGDEAKKLGTFANTALLARRMVEPRRPLRAGLHQQLGHALERGRPLADAMQGRRSTVPRTHRRLCARKAAAVRARRNALIVWGGEFGRTIYSQGGPLAHQNYGCRDHHPRCFTMWMAGGGFKGGTVLGETDDFSYNITKDPVHVRDFHATVLHQLGFDHERFTFKSQGLDQKLTGVIPARVVNEILS